MKDAINIIMAGSLSGVVGYSAATSRWFLAGVFTALLVSWFAFLTTDTWYHWRRQ